MLSVELLRGLPAAMVHNHLNNTGIASGRVEVACFLEGEDSVFERCNLCDVRPYDSDGGSLT